MSVVAERVEVGTGLVRMTVAGVGFAVSLDAVATVMSPSQIVARTSVDGLIVGEVPSRLGVLPVVDVRRLFALGEDTRPAAAPDKVDTQRLIVLRGDPPVGLLVDEVTMSTATVSEDIHPLPRLCGSPSRLLTYAVAWSEGGTPDLMLDVDALHLAVGASLSGDGHLSMDEVPQLPIFDDATDGQSLQVRIGAEGIEWSLPVALVRHIDDYRIPATLPRAHPAILGLLSWRRHPIPLLDPCLLLGLTPSTLSRLVVVGAPSIDGVAPDDVFCALAVREVIGISSV